MDRAGLRRSHGDDEQCTPESTRARPTATALGPGAPRRRRSRLALALSVGASIVFVVLWVGFAYALLVDPELPGDAWSRLIGLEPPTSIVVWILILPIVFGSWIWSSDLPAIVSLGMTLLLVLWTALAFDGVRRALVGR